METGKISKRPNGEAVAALVSAMVGLLVMGITHVGSVASNSFKDSVLSVGKAWIPNATGLGPTAERKPSY